MAGQDVEWNEVQGIVLSSYWAKPYTRYFLLNIRDGREQAARAWLGQLEEKKWLSLNDDRRPNGASLNVAFSFSGLKKLGLKKEELDTFPWDFRDGMTSALRSNLLADRGYNDPANWEWGRNGAEPHLLVMLYANEKEIVPLAKEVKKSLEDKGAFEEVRRWHPPHERDHRRPPHECPPEGHESTDELRACPKVGYRLMRDPYNDDGSSDSYDDDGSTPSSKLVCEHFGFADGLSQPAIETSPRSRKFSKRGDFDDIVRSGEFILGYVNERGQLPISPSVNYAPGKKLPIITYADRSLALSPPLKAWKQSPAANFFKKWSPKIWKRWFKQRPPPVPWKDNRRLDFGRNGTFLVYRQLEQDVFAFDALIQKASKQLGYDTQCPLNDEANFRRMLAAKLIGRWDDGTPLTLEPRSPPPHKGEALKTVNNFGFADEDTDGLRCPIGAHIRRANPRDTLDPDPNNSMRRNNRHRLLRRGRVYGPRVKMTAAWGRDKETKITPDKKERGLHFVCINASIESQFEFIQQTWMNTSFFGGLHEEVDPLVGVSDDPTRAFTVQGAPISRRIEWTQPEIGPLVKVKGGAYFFLPGRKALAYLAKDLGRAEAVTRPPDQARQ